MELRPLALTQIDESTEELGETELRNIDVFDVEEFKQKVATALIKSIAINLC